jgi:hypothetical protein
MAFNREEIFEKTREENRKAKERRDKRDGKPAAKQVEMKVRDKLKIRDKIAIMRRDIIEKSSYATRIQRDCKIKIHCKGKMEIQELDLKIGEMIFQRKTGEFVSLDISEEIERSLKESGFELPPSLDSELPPSLK